MDTLLLLLTFFLSFIYLLDFVEKTVIYLLSLSTFSIPTPVVMRRIRSTIFIQENSDRVVVISQIHSQCNVHKPDFENDSFLCPVISKTCICSSSFNCFATFLNIKNVIGCLIWSKKNRATDLRTLCKVSTIYSAI